MISGWWLILVFVIGAYAGIMLLAVMIVSARRVPQPDSPRRADDQQVSNRATARLPEGAVARPNREHTGRKRGSTKQRSPDPLANQANFQF